MQADIDDDILRTVASTTLFEPLQQMQTAAATYAYAPLSQNGPIPSTSISQASPAQWSTVQRSTLRHETYRAPLQAHAANAPQFTPHQPNAAPYQFIPRAMPLRAIVTQNSALEPLFDLPPNQRAGISYVVPSPKNVLVPIHPGMNPVQRRERWKAEHVNYLYELMELAILKMNRPLQWVDFPAITEALHRHFRANGGIPERGYNAVHSFATRQRAYNDLVQRVLPDINFPDFVPRARTARPNYLNGLTHGS